MNCLTYPVAQRFTGRSRSTDSGAALVITLACIVILTALVLAVLTHSMLETQVSDASASQTESSLFARGAVDSVIGELKQEITAGSSSTYPPTGSDVRDPNCFFLPKTNQTMVPYRMDPGAPLNVVKRSAYNVPFYTGAFYSATWPAPNWAANLSSTNPGPTGRAISMARWNKPLLMPVASAADLTPTNTFLPPDWIYMTRMGGPSTNWDASLVSSLPSNTNSVVGRYAYVVYDEGGLLDANAAGYPSSVTAAMVRNKISEACADLTQIGMTNSDIDALVAWRNQTNGASATAYTNYIYSTATNAFLTPAPGERLFTSRQQLIAFLTQNVANGDSTAMARLQGALPFLTTFSRELNAPSWYPQTNLAVATFNSYPYLKNATNSATIASTTNIFTPLARAGSSFTNVSDLTVRANQAVAFSRFPLSRLNWLGPTGAVAGNGESTANILQSFGLQWDASNSAWQYVGTGGAVQSTILPISQIAGREPNFFELLKAAILSGSVGVTPGQQIAPFPSPSTIDSRYGTSDEQIIQIGLAMIDQASSAPLPVRIEFGANNGKAPGGNGNGYAAGDSLALYGNKNLPYLYRMVYSPYRPTTEPADATGATQTMLDAWTEPVFWNPYQAVTTNTAPLQIRVRADSADASGIGTPAEIGSQTVATSGGVNVVLSCLPEIPCGASGYGATLELDSGNGATLNSATTNPVVLATLAANSAFTFTINDSRAASPWAGGPANADQYTEGSTSYVGFWLGHTYAPNPPDNTENELMTKFTVPANFGTAIFYYAGNHNRTVHGFVLEANYGTAGSPNFLEVQRMAYSYTSGSYIEEFDNFTKIQRRMNLFTLNDPRTSRFGFDVLQPNGYDPSGAALSAVDTVSPTNTTFPYPGPSTLGSGPTTNIIYAPVTSSTAGIVGGNTASARPIVVNTVRFADNSATSGSTTSPTYQDMDGAQRPGDAWWSSATANTLPMREDTPQDRPVILNRSFYSVGELGYVFRDTPWRSLNFCSTNSADAGLLDFFSVNDGYGGMTNAPVVAGVLDLNTPHPEVLAAMLNGATRAQLYPANDVSSSDATLMANTITSLTGTLPLINKSEIATRVAPNDPTVSSGNTDSNIKERRETIVRALASAGQVRTWNLMIDVIAQTGHLPPTATGFNNFIVTAEQRYWAHVAIDRYTGQVISIQLEPVSE